MSRPTLPPLAAIRVFEAAARHGTFTAAAAELGMTQAAVSYQIKVLEERVGAPLFYRQARGVSLSQAGEALAQQASAALDTLADAFEQAKGETQSTLAISSVPTFATYVLSQRLGRFQMAHPQIAVRIDVSENLVDFQTSGFGVAIRSGHGDWPGLVAHKLIDMNFSPVLSPALARSAGGVNNPRDLLKLPLIARADPRWARWFEAAGVDAVDLTDGPHNPLGPQVLEVQAVMADQGVALLTPAFFAEALALGQLVRPFDITYGDGEAYWLAYPQSHRNAPKIKAFRLWLQGEMESFKACRQAGGGRMVVVGHQKRKHSR